MRTPIIEDLQPARFDIGLLDVNPVVFNKMLIVFLHLHFLEKKPYRNEIAILQGITYFANVCRNGDIERVDEFLYGHSGEKVVAIETTLLARGVESSNCNHFVSTAVNACHTKIGNDLAAHGFDFSGHGLPHLSGTILWIKELFDERRFCLLLRNIFLLAALQLFLDDVLNRFLDRKTLDALLAPLCADLVARHSPHFLRVRLEERVVELASEAVDKELLQVLDVLNRHRRAAHIAEANAHGANRAQLAQRVSTKSDRIIEERAQEIDARFAAAHQHDFVRVAPVTVPVHTSGEFASLSLICDLNRLLYMTISISILGHGGFNRHVLEPPVHHAIALREEAMTADVDAITFVVHGARDATHLVALFKHDGLGIAVAQKFESGSQSSRTGADDDSSFRPMIHGNSPGTIRLALNSGLALQ